MCAQRLLPAVQFLGRSLTAKSEIFQGVKVHNQPNFNNVHSLQNNGTGVHDQCNYTTSAPICGGQLSQWSNYSDQQNFSQPIWTKPNNSSQTVTRTIRGTYCKELTRSFNSGSVSILKEFEDHENEHAHTVLRSLPIYSSTTIPRHRHRLSLAPVTYIYHHSDKDWEQCSCEDVANEFILLSGKCISQVMNLEDATYTKLCRAIILKIPQFNDDCLLQVLYSLTLWPPTYSTNSANFVGVWNALDQTCSNRISKWDMSRSFLVADHWYALRLSRISIYNVEMTRKLRYHISSMTPAQFVQYLFYMNLGRRVQSMENCRILELRFFQILNKISVEELGIIAMGLFKTQTFLKNEILIEAIATKTIQEADTVTEITLASILKLIRRSVKMHQDSVVQELCQACLLQLARLNNMCLLQVALLGTDLMSFHPEAVGAVAEKFAREIKDIRLKDIERITFALSLYNYVPPDRPDIFELIANELRDPSRVPEINLYPKCFTSCVSYLVTMGFLAPDLISACLQPSMISHAIKMAEGINIGRELNELDYAIEIEGPVNYAGYRIDPQKREDITKENLASIPSPLSINLNHQERFLLDVFDKLATILGGIQCVQMTMVLPHIKSVDLVFCTSRDGDPVAIPQQFLSLPLTALKHPVTAVEGLQWNVLIVGGRNSYLRNKDLIRGTVAMRARQLSKLGYSVSIVPFSGYLNRNVRTKMATIQNALQEGSSLSNVKHLIDVASRTLKMKNAVNLAGNAYKTN